MLRFLGLTPVFSNKDVTVFNLGEYSGGEVPLFISTRTKGFRCTTWIYKGCISNLLNLLSRHTLREMITDPHRHKLEALLSKKTGKKKA